jgi:multidrug efflux system outer membrane protein
MKQGISARLGLQGLLAATVLAATGCTVGPDYERPAVSQPQEFRDQSGPVDPVSIADLPWWAVFNDGQLQALVTEGLNNNHDIAIAAARVEQARARLGVSRSQGAPQIEYQADGGAERSVIQEQDDVGALNILGGRAVINAAWELDLWGRIRRSNEAARAGLFAQEEVRRGVMLTLVSDIAAGYFRLLSLDRELAIAEESNVAYKRMFDLFDLRHGAGRDSALPVSRARAAYESSLSRVADLKRQIAQQENAISILTGGYPRAIQRGQPLTAQTIPQMPVGLTTDLLRRRPDIRQAEQEMIQANAEVGVAVANFYPRIGLAGLLGFAGVSAEGGIDGTFGLWKLGATLAGPIFNGGRLQSIYEGRKAFWDESVAQYRKRIVTAFQETSDALVAQQTLVGRRTALENQVRALRNSVDLALTRYDAGRASYFEVLEAQQQLFPAEDQLARTQQDQLQAMVSLYKALGGGWKLSDEQWARPS